MFRLLLTIVMVTAVTVGGVALFSTIEGEQGRITIDYGGTIWEFTLIEATLFLIVGLIVAYAAIWVIRLCYTFVLFLLGDETAINKFFTRSRERRGLEAVSNGLVAIAAGDARTAQRKAAKAEKLLGKPELTRLLNAEAAKLAGDREKALTYYKALAGDKATAFVGLRGLMQEAEAAGDIDRALMLAEKAHAANPRDTGMMESLYALQSRKFDWTGARATLKKMRRAAALEQADADRREGALALAQAEDAGRAGDTELCRDLAVQATRLDPANSDAACLAARTLIAAGSKRAATKVVLDSWRHRPDARLAAAYAEIEPDESPAERRRRFQRLIEMHPDHPESLFLRAELALVAGDWVGSRAALSDLRETEPSARTCAIQAAIARGEGEPDHIVRGWLARALSAPRNGVSEAALSHAAMLPLVIGDDPAPADRPQDAEVDAPEPESDDETLAPEAEPAPHETDDDAPKPQHAA